MPGRRYTRDHGHQRADQPADDHGLRGIIDQSIETLLGEIGHGMSHHLRDYLAFAARFHRYSLHNQLLIYAQCPHATYVAGYRTWQQLGYQVAKGQKGIRILAPHSYVREGDETGAEKRSVYFVSVAVFDASQLANLDARPLPDFFTPLGDDQQELCHRLEGAIRADGIAIRESRYTEGAQGLSTHGEIVLKAGLDSRNRLLVLVHEYAHELLHWQEGERFLTHAAASQR